MTRTYANCQAYFSRPLIFLLLSVCVPLMFSNRAADGKQMYWTDMRGIHRANLDGKNVETLLPLILAAPRGIAVDSVRRKIYWVDRLAQKIQRANLDGTEIEDVFNQTVGPLHDITIDTRQGKIYWTDGLFGSPRSRIRRANLDGTQVEDIATELEIPTSIAVDSIRGKIYWIDQRKDKKRIWHANLDGTNVGNFTWEGVTDGMTLDEVEGTLYWSDVSGFRIWRANPDGTNVEVVIRTDHTRVWGITVAFEARKIYWVDYSGVHRANLDGTAVEHLVTTQLKDPWGIAVDENGGKIYWVDAGNYKIQRANLDGEHVEDIITTDFTFLYGIAVDANREKVYWTDGISSESRQTVRRAALDGTTIEEIVTVDSKFPVSIAVDPVMQKLYWRDTFRIQRSNLNGSQPEHLVGTPVSSLIGGIAIDPIGREIYWTEPNLGIILRSDIDGTNVQELVKEGVKRPFGIAVDSSGEKIYWTDLGKAPDFITKIQRANLDGTDIEELVAVERNSLRGIAIDADGAKIYWVNHAGKKIQRSNLDGTDVEDLVTGVLEPQFIALDFGAGRPEGKRIVSWGNLRQHALLQNFPNPFHLETWMPFYLTHNTDVTLQIYDINGHIVHTLELGTLKAGFYDDSTQAAYWNGRSGMGETVSSGIYFYQLRTDNYSVVRRMVFLK